MSDWHEARRRGIGGSDWGHVLGIEPWGCTRRLWYDKRGVEPDIAQEENRYMRRGHKLEPLVVAEFEEQTGRKTRRVGRIRRNQDLPDWWIGNPDRRIVPAETVRWGEPEAGILECKTTGEWRWRQIERDGLPQEWVLQLQHYLSLTGCSWGALAILEPTGWRLRVAQFEHDRGLEHQMMVAGDRFWAQVENGPAPEKLDISDNRCKSCPYLETCHGDTLDRIAAEEASDDESLEVMTDVVLERLLRQRQEIAAVLDRAREALDDVNEKIKAHLGGPSRVAIGPYRVYYTESTRTSLDTRRLKTELPEVFERYQRRAVVRRLVVKEV